jgi:hypothetical protein
MTVVDLKAAAEAIAEMDRLQHQALGSNASVGDVRRAVVRRQEVEALLERVRELEGDGQ